MAILVAVVGLLVATAGPAAAEEVDGAGAGGGWEFAPEPAELCGDLPAFGAYYTYDNFVLTHESNYAADDGTVFVGLTTMEITTDDVVQAPQGAMPGPCGGIVEPAPVQLTAVEITGSSPTGSIHCDNVRNGTYLRVTTTVVFDFVVECDITSSTGTVSDQDVRHVVEGEQVACIPAPCPGGPSDSTSVLTTAFEASTQI